jgi:UDP-N-acetylmuramoylalanine--D-glutamate ligase
MSGPTDYVGTPVLVAGAGVSGASAALALARVGAEVTVVDRRGTDSSGRLEAAGIAVLPEPPAPPDGTKLVVTSPGLRPDHPLLLAAADAGIEVIGDVELAWRLRPADAAPWLALTGTNGKTTTVGMLEAILRAAGLRAVATGNVGFPVVDAVDADPPYDVLAVELSSFQLHWSSSLRPRAAAVLNLAPDHVDWHGSFDAYVAAKARILQHDATNVVNADDPTVLRLAHGLPDAVSFTLGEPGPGQVGIVAGNLVDRAFGIDRGTEQSVVLAGVSDVRPIGPHNVANALAAASLARAYGVTAVDVRNGLRGFVPGAHRNAQVGVVGGAVYVDDSKATNPHAAAASLSAYERVVWVAGGQLKGAPVDELVAAVHPRLAAAVLLGADRAQFADAFARHAPDLPVVEVTADDDGAMTEVVTKAAALARPGDTVLLAPAAASLDMFADYAARGDAFAAAVRGLEEE